MKLIKRYFPEITLKQKSQFLQLKECYVYWNAQINVISRKDIDALYLKHILHSLAIAKVQSFVKGTTILDIGTGGGFPGIPLAILFPESDFYLVDSIGKKIKVVAEIATALGLKNVKTAQIRAEKVEGTFDFIVSRAVTKMDNFVKWTKNKYKKQNKHNLPNGILYLKGGDLQEELKNFPMAKQYLITDYFDEPFFETKKVVYIPMVKK